MRLTGIDAVFSRVHRLEERLDDAMTPMHTAGDYLQAGIESNIDTGGDPSVPLAASTIAGRLRRGNSSTQPLVDTGEMRNSIEEIFHGRTLEVGTDKVQARRLNFGYPGGSGRGHSRTPARPFMMFRDREVDHVGELFMEHYSS